MVAQKLCEAGAVAVNGVAARSSRTVRAGDEIALRRRDRLLTVRVVAVPSSKQTARHEASNLYEILADTRLERDPLDV